MPRVHAQAAYAVLMVRPIDFDYNHQTAHDNVFQNVPTHNDKTVLNEEAMFEFEICVEELRAEGVKVIILDEIAAQSHIKTPDAVFCNNWFSTHNNGLMITYPMSTPNRREEVKKTPIVRDLFEKNGFLVEDVKVLHDGQNTNEYLESTGSMVFDHLHGVIYAARSIRTNHNMIMRFMDLFKGHYTECIEFDTKSSHGKPFYHTNVMMSIGQQYAVVCSEAIIESDRSQVLNSLRKTGRDVIEITLDQAEKYFCGNILQLRGERSRNFVIAMSESCLRGFTTEQRLKLRNYGKIVTFPVAKTIEYIGGGSARCMLGEVFLPRHDPDMHHSHDNREECKPHSVETD